jgi:hypothetical protein
MVNNNILYPLLTYQILLSEYQTKGEFISSERDDKKEKNCNIYYSLLIVYLIFMYKIC